MDAPWTDRVLQVSELTAAIKSILQEGFPDLSVEGEISNFRPASSGHCYFALKDAGAVIQCVLFRGAAAKLSFQPQDGNLVQIRASLDVYPPRGTYQLIVRDMQPAGEGRILAMLEARKKQLQAEGVFDRELPLPWFPRSLAVVTSPTGAAVRDVLEVLRRRGAGVDVRILPVPVQGQDAGERIATMIRYADRHKLGDVILVTRGGGSLEDLLPFSEVAVVRAISSTTTPVISAVGHETDLALSDFAADYRAPTPSAAAEVVCAGEQEVRERVHRAGSALVRDYLARLERVQLRLKQVTTAEIRYRYRNFVQPWYQRVDDAIEETRRAFTERISTVKLRLERAMDRIEGASPYRALDRGYAIVRDRETGLIVTRAEKTLPGQALETQFADGAILVHRDGTEQK